MMSSIKSLLRKIYYAVFRPWWPKTIKNIQDILEKYNVYRKNVSFIQIGSNDGVTGDPLRKFIIDYHWCGTFVEPIPYYFKQLETNYKDIPHLNFVNKAISSTEGRKSFYYLKPKGSDQPVWYKQIGSFNKDIILSHKRFMPDIEDSIIEVQIETITFERLVETTETSEFQLLHIDTEGHDFEILKFVNLDKYMPEIILYEMKHLSRSDFRQSVNLLKRKNYHLFLQEGDCLALHQSVLHIMGNK